MPKLPRAWRAGAHPEGPNWLGGPPKHEEKIGRDLCNHEETIHENLRLHKLISCAQIHSLIVVNCTGAKEMQEETEMAAAIAARERVEESKRAHQEVERKTKEMEVAATARKQDEEKDHLRQEVGRKAVIHLTMREEKNGKYARIQEEHTREKHVHNLTNTQDYLLHISDSVDEPEHIAPHTSKELEKPILQLSLVNDNCKWDNSKRHVLEAVMVVQQGIRCRVMAAWRCTAGREEQTRMHLLSGATRIARHCDIKYAFNALLLNRRVSSLQHVRLDKDYGPWKPCK